VIVYNITFNIDDTVEKDWLTWIKNEHIPDILATGLFSTYKLFRILVEEELGGKTYALQFFAQSLDEIKLYQLRYKQMFDQMHQKKFGGKYVDFRTVLEEMD
jgi:hypothetical protein